MTGGDYQIERTITYPDFPQSKIVTNARIRTTTKRQWDTEVTIEGVYDGPTDVISVRDYQLTWRADGNNLAESGSAMLMLKSGGSVRQVWSSTIIPEKRLAECPPAGQQIEISIALFEMDENGMSYAWDGMAMLRKEESR